jgi:hypothetical protein
MKPPNRGTLVLCIIIALGLLLGTLGVLSLSEQDEGFTPKTTTTTTP